MWTSLDQGQKNQQSDMQELKISVRLTADRTISLDEKRRDLHGAVYALKPRPLPLWRL